MTMIYHGSKNTRWDISSLPIYESVLITVQQYKKTPTVNI
jgi:hypothetical protein